MSWTITDTGRIGCGGDGMALAMQQVTATEQNSE